MVKMPKMWPKCEPNDENVAEMTNMWQNAQNAQNVAKKLPGIAKSGNPVWTSMLICNNFFSSPQHAIIFH